MNILVLFFEIAGTVAFSISGGIITLKNKMDLFGVMVMGFTTAVVYMSIYYFVNPIIASIVGMLSVFSLRVLSSEFLWNLPKAE